MTPQPLRGRPHGRTPHHGLFLLLMATLMAALARGAVPDPDRPGRHRRHPRGPAEAGRLVRGPPAPGRAPVPARSRPRVAATSATIPASSCPRRDPRPLLRHAHRPPRRRRSRQNAPRVLRPHLALGRQGRLPHSRRHRHPTRRHPGALRAEVPLAVAAPSTKAPPGPRRHADRLRLPGPRLLHLGQGGSRQAEDLLRLLRPGCPSGQRPSSAT
jgi:hypothetical protein